VHEQRTLKSLNVKPFVDLRWTIRISNDKGFRGRCVANSDTSCEKFTGKLSQ